MRVLFTWPKTRMRGTRTPVPLLLQQHSKNEMKKGKMENPIYLIKIGRFHLGSGT